MQNSRKIRSRSGSSARSAASWRRRGNNPYTFPKCVACSRTATAEPSAPLGPADDPSVLNGSYRADISAAYLESKGISPTEAYFNGGIFDLTFKDGVFSHHLDRDDSTCTGTYTISGPRVTVGCRFPDGSTFEPLFSADWALSDGELRFSEIEPVTYLLAQAMWGGKSFLRIGDAP